MTEKEVIFMCDELENTIQILINKLIHIKSSLCSGFREDYKIQLEQSIILYHSLDDIFSSHEDFLKLHNKSEHFYAMKQELHQYILFLNNYKDSIDCVFNITREQIVQWCFTIKDILVSFSDEKLNDLAYEDSVHKINLLHIEFRDILTEDSNDLEFDFSYVYSTKQYVLFLSVVYDILLDIRSFNINEDIKEDCISLLLSMPNKHLLNKIFQGL